MKKFLTILAGVGMLATSTMTGVLNINQTNLLTNSNSSLESTYATIFDWQNVKIDHNVEVDGDLLGVVVKDNTAVDVITTSLPWSSTFQNINFLIADGNFALNTYQNPVFWDNVLLSFNAAKSNQYTRVWSFEQTNEQKTGLVGLGRQTTTIEISVTAQYNQYTKKTFLSVESYVYAKTSLTTFSCSTSSEITNISFIDTN